MLLSSLVATQERRVTAAFMLGLVVALAYILYAFLLAEAEASDHATGKKSDHTGDHESAAASSSARDGKPVAKRVRIEHDTND